jgi:hypothetical protein
MSLKIVLLLLLISGTSAKLFGQQDTSGLVESFSDSTNIGRKKLNKIELRRFHLHERDSAVVRFYRKIGKGWQMTNEYWSGKDDFLDCNPEISDFDADGLKDFTFVSARAARGANEVRTLFVYDKTADTLICVQNSEEFPNLHYNYYLHCIDAMVFTGSVTSVFLRLDHNQLRMFASVEAGGEWLEVSEYDKDGNKKMLSRKKHNIGDTFIRYKSYRPLLPYKADFK